MSLLCRRLIQPTTPPTFPETAAVVIISRVINIGNDIERVIFYLTEQAADMTSCGSSGNNVARVINIVNRWITASRTTVLISNRTAKIIGSSIT